MIIYIVPLVVFVILSTLILYISSNAETEKEGNKKYIKAIVPSVLVSILVYLFIKYRESSHEPMMPGNYFDSPVIQ